MSPDDNGLLLGWLWIALKVPRQVVFTFTLLVCYKCYLIATFKSYILSLRIKLKKP